MYALDHESSPVTSEPAAQQDQSPLPSANLGQKHGNARQVEAWKRACEVAPLGVQSNFRYWGDESTPYIARGKGSHIWDLDGNEYIDFRGGFGPVILGHGHEEVCDAVNEAVRDGTAFAMSTLREVRVAEQIVRLCPPVEMVRFCNSGTEATMHAIRLARGWTGREKVIKFEGHYHGVHDYVLWSTAGSNPAALGYRYDPIPFQSSSGIPHGMRDLIITLPFNDEEILEEAIDRQGHNVAAIIVEAVMGNSASIVARPEWLDFVRKICDENGIVFILDEVKTGFRIAPGGAAEYYGIQPDLATYAKALGNGFPVAAFGGKREIMEAIGPGRITHAGTYNGNAVATAAAEKVLELLADGSVLRHVGVQGKKLSDGISEILTRFDLPHEVAGPPQMWGLLLGDKPVREFRDYFHTRRQLYLRIAMGLIERGVMPEPDAREPWFMMYSHTDEDIAYVLQAFEDSVKELPAHVLHPQDELEFMDI
jgi:glutamate-1-semialdehyde 2,1-aminomutase